MPKLLFGDPPIAILRVGKNMWACWMKVFEAFLVAPSSKASAAPIASKSHGSNNVPHVHPWEPFWAFEFQKRPKKKLFLHMELISSDEHLQIKSASQNVSCENNANQIIGVF